MDIIPELVGIRIMHKRKEHGYSQEQLSELINISKNHLSSIERGHNLPTVKVTHNICNVLGGSLDYYYCGKIKSETEEEIIKTFQKLSQTEQENTLFLLNAYINQIRKFD